MNNVQVLINELKDMKALYDKGFMSLDELNRIQTMIQQEIAMEANK